MISLGPENAEGYATIIKASSLAMLPYHKLSKQLSNRTPFSMRVYGTIGANWDVLGTMAGMGVHRRPVSPCLTRLDLSLAPFTPPTRCRTGLQGARVSQGLTVPALLRHRRRLRPSNRVVRAV